MYYQVQRDESLTHHGILGQKWGVRRFQNEDGTRTAAGKARYSTSDIRDKMKKFSDKAKDVAKKVKKALDETDDYEDEKESRSQKKPKMSREHKFSIHSDEVSELEREMQADDEFMEKIQKLQENGAPDWKIESTWNRELEKRLDKMVSESISMQMDRDFAEAFDDYGDDGEDWFKSNF